MKVNLFNQPKENVGEGVSRVWLISDEVGSNNFYIRVFEILPGRFTKEDSHNYEHGIFVLEGKGLAVIEGERINLEKYDALFIPPNFRHQIYNVSNNEVLRFICVVPSSYKRR